MVDKGKVPQILVSGAGGFGYSRRASPTDDVHKKLSEERRGRLGTRGVHTGRVMGFSHWVTCGRFLTSASKFNMEPNGGIFDVSTHPFKGSSHWVTRSRKVG